MGRHWVARTYINKGKHPLATRDPKGMCVCQDQKAS